MDNQLVNIKSMTDEQIMLAIGQDDGAAENNSLSRLSINRSPEDDNGNKLPIGHFAVYDPEIGQTVYGKPVTLRPFIGAMQYMHFDPDKNEYVNRSIIVKNWKEEPIDALGGVRCGKVLYKDRDSLTPEQQAIQRTIRCYKLIYGLVSFDGVKADGSKHAVKNLPVLYRVTGTAFTPVSTALDKLKKLKKLMYTCTLTLETMRQKKGGNVFYVPEITVNGNANLQLSNEDMSTLTIFQDSINTENESVITAYKEAKSKKANGDDAKAVEIIDDMNDQLPEDVLSK